jgi:Glycosyl transferase family 2
MTQALLPIGLVLPTLNARQVLPQHLTELRTWADCLPEIIVVDSHSTDGTAEFIQDQIRHPGLRILQHPRGLYESWNFGVRQVTAEFTYIATAGDPITLSGLKHLLEVAERFQSDVVVSPPIFQKPDGEVMEGKHWRIHQYLEARGITQPGLIPAAHCFLTAVFAGLSGLMGSSASNLYRTSMLKTRPFPTSFGHNGDTAWGAAHAFDVRFALTPERCARFLLHPGAGHVSQEDALQQERGVLQLARDTLREALRRRTAPPAAEAFWQIIDEFEPLRERARLADLAYYGARGRPFPWFLRPGPWRARRERDQCRAAIRRLWTRSLAQFSF